MAQSNYKNYFIWLSEDDRLTPMPIRAKSEKQAIAWFCARSFKEGLIDDNERSRLYDKMKDEYDGGKLPVTNQGYAYRSLAGQTREHAARVIAAAFSQGKTESTYENYYDQIMHEWTLTRIVSTYHGVFFSMPERRHIAG